LTLGTFQVVQTLPNCRTQLVESCRNVFQYAVLQVARVRTIEVAHTNMVRKFDELFHCIRYVTQIHPISSPPEAVCKMTPRQHALRRGRVERQHFVASSRTLLLFENETRKRRLLHQLLECGKLRAGQSELY